MSHKKAMKILATLWMNSEEAAAFVARLWVMETREERKALIKEAKRYVDTCTTNYNTLLFLVNDRPSVESGEAAQLQKGE